MAGISLRDYQLDAVKRMKNGCILCGGVGSGKSRTGLAYYYICQGGEIGTDEYVSMDDVGIKDLYIITTARKRDTKEWEAELIPFLLSPNKEDNLYHNKVVIDSWNNIHKYAEVSDAFFIFDEHNDWILLSATPGDTWSDYIPVFVANGFYKNRTQFKNDHIVYRWVNGSYPKIDRYLNTGRLIRLRNSILVNMDFQRETVSHHEDVYVQYDILSYKSIYRNRWNIWEDKPIENASELCLALRRVVNSDESRCVALLGLLERHSRAIIFYNYDYELAILKSLYYGDQIEIAEWNGHKHQPIPDTDKWIYLVQYNAGAEGWNCIKTDTIIFYSQNYSYKVMTQASGRIDRLNTPYKDLYYYHFKTYSGIDLAISKALKKKQNFNEGKFISDGK